MTSLKNDKMKKAVDSGLIDVVKVQQTRIKLVCTLGQTVLYERILKINPKKRDQKRDRFKKKFQSTFVYFVLVCLFVEWTPPKGGSGYSLASKPGI